MLKRIVILVGAVLLGALRVGAQDTPWTAWLYNPNGQMTYVTDIGTVLQQATLPILPGQRYPPRVTASRAGQLIAYVTANNDFNAHRLVVYNPTTATVLTDLIYIDVVDTNLSQYTTPYIFNGTDTSFAFALGQVDGLWRILILDVFGGAVLHELRADAPAVTALEIPSGTNIIPIVRRYDNNEVAFTLRRVEQGSAEPTELGSYLWNIGAGAVTENTLYPGLDNDILPFTGEIILPVQDPTFPATGGANTIQVANPGSADRFPFYAAESATLDAAHFVQNGERILVRARTDAGTEWRVLERNGTLVGVLPIEMRSIVGLAGGFLYLTADDPATLMYVNTRDGLDAGVPMGQAQPGENIQLVWAGDSVRAQSPDALYRTWINLNDTVSVAQATAVAQGAIPSPTVEATPVVSEPEFFVAPTPNLLPTRSSFQTQLTAGSQAIVTPAGHASGLHTDPEAASPQIILLYTDMIVDVLDGPNITDGYIWWQVRTTSGEQQWTGWAIEGATGEAWLAPYTSPAQ